MAQKWNFYIPFHDVSGTFWHSFMGKLHGEEDNIH